MLVRLFEWRVPSTVTFQLGVELASVSIDASVQSTLPPTIPHPPINAENGFIFGVTKIDIPNNQFWDWWRAPYLWTTPYVPNSGWVAGDRVAYGGAYAFMVLDGEIVGRVTFRALSEAASYMRINDTYMPEGQRYYDGSLCPPGTVQVPFGELPASTQSYETELVPDERPVIAFFVNHVPIEIRDYRTTVVETEGVTFDELDPITEPFEVDCAFTGIHIVNDRRTVLARENGVPTVVVYYDGMGEGSVIG